MRCRLGRSPAPSIRSPKDAVEIAFSIAGARRLIGGRDGRVGLVPTMGNLHDGHLALVRACRAACDVCVVSIFVNPTQFGPNEDLESYPRTLEADLALLDAEGADIVFKPSVAEMYPDGQKDHVKVTVPGLNDILCGKSRPVHFDGVATVVAKLFNIVRPQQAFFGEKDWQQLTVIRRMARQLDMPVEVIGVPTVREPSGLAMSSRNGYLTEQERERASLLYKTLMSVKSGLEDDLRTQMSSGAEGRGYAKLVQAGFDVEYLEVLDADRLRRTTKDTTHWRILAAARLGKARLIDNVGLER